MDIMEILHPFIIAVATAIAGVVGAYAAKFLKAGVSWVQTKIGIDNYKAAKDVAYGLYIYLEDKYKLSGMGKEKKSEMEQLLLDRFPSLTQEELDSINKEVWLTFNEQWFEENKKVKVPERIDG